LSLLPMDAAPRSKVDAGVAPRPTLPWQRSSSVAAHAGETAVPLLRPRNHARAESLQYRFVCAMQHNFPVGLANQDGFRCLGPFLDKTGSTAGSTGWAGWAGSIARSGDVATSKVLPSHRTLLLVPSRLTRLAPNLGSPEAVVSMPTLRSSLDSFA
jgi:hypothetical protein